MQIYHQTITRTAIAVLLLTFTLHSTAQTFKRLVKYKQKGVHSVKTTVNLFSQNLTDDTQTKTDDQKSSINASTDITLPDLSNSGINIIPTPSFFYNKIYDEHLAFSGTAFGTSLGTDSNLEKLGSKLLLPQASLFGLKFDGANTIDILGMSEGSEVNLGIGYEVNLLFKKVSFFDTASQKSTNFVPFCIQPKVGLIGSFFKSNVIASFYYDMFTVQSENDQFKSFFKTTRKAFFYPEFNIAANVDIGSDDSKTILVGLQFIVNNHQMQMLTASGSNLIPYLKIGFNTKF